MKYKILGESLPVVLCDLEPGESVITEKGSMSWMSPNMKMETNGTSVGRAFGRIFSGESIFQNKYTAVGGPGQIAFASSFPGSIKAFSITPDNPMIVQKSGFLASEQGVTLSTFFQKKFSSGFFGGEGFVMQKLSGNGVAFVEIDGSVVEYNLEAGQSMVIDTGYLAAMSASCNMEIVSVPGIKNKLFGGEGLFNTVVHGPGKVMVQTMPRSAVAASLAPFLPMGGNS